MSLESIIEMSFFAIFTGGLGTLFWARMNRLEAQIIDIRATMGGLATREELGGLATQQELGLLRSEFAQFRAEIKDEISAMRHEMSAMRQELAVMRSDLTHVALAVGVNRPKPAEG